MHYTVYMLQLSIYYKLVSQEWEKITNAFSKKGDRRRIFTGYMFNSKLENDPIIL